MKISHEENVLTVSESIKTELNNKYENDLAELTSKYNLQIRKVEEDIAKKANETESIFKENLEKAASLVPAATLTPICKAERLNLVQAFKESSGKTLDSKPYLKLLQKCNNESKRQRGLM